MKLEKNDSRALMLFVTILYFRRNLLELDSLREKNFQVLLTLLHFHIFFLLLINPSKINLLYLLNIAYKPTFVKLTCI